MNVTGKNLTARVVTVELQELRVPSLRDEAVREVTLLELQRRNCIDDKGKASEHISFVPGADVDDFRMIWK